MFGKLARIFASPLRIKVVKFFALQPDSACTIASIPALVGGSKKKVRSEIASLVRAGVLVSKKVHDGMAYQWNVTFRHAGALGQFVEEATVPNDDEIADIFKRIGSVVVVITAGTLIRETRSSTDLLIISRQPKDPRVAIAVRKLETLFAMPLRYTVMGQKEFVGRRESYDRLVRDVFDFRHRVVLGRISGV